MKIVKYFFKLLELDSGFGYHKGKIFHCFDMTNIDEIKAHLKDIFIDTLITYKQMREFALLLKQRLKRLK